MSSVAAADPPQPSGSNLFERDVLPIVTAHCLKCHGLEGRKANLDLRTVEFMIRGGDGGPVLLPDMLDQSPLLQRVQDRTMPPEGELPLTTAQIETISNWVLVGARAENAREPVEPSTAPLVSDADRQWWAFQRPVRPTIPATSTATATAATPSSPIDAFILEKLQAVGLSKAPPADPRVILRRAYIDLTGLPPSPEETAAFLAQCASPSGTAAAYERLIDQLLASPHFGERWGRHWLDAAGYVDVIGSDNDAAIIKPGENKWLYRDFVVRALNDDLPFDEFVRRQLAGDEMVDWRRAEHFTPEIKDLLVATGYLRAAIDDTDQKELNTADIRFRVLHLTIDILGTNLLALTTGCARCHAHKFDPIPHRDYYRLMAALTPAYNVQEWLPLNERFVPDVSPAEQAQITAHNTAVDQAVAALAKSRDEIEAPYQAAALDKKLEALPEQIRADVKVALAVSGDQRSEIQRYLADKFASQLAVTSADIEPLLSEIDKTRVSELKGKISTEEARRKAWGKLHALVDVGPAPATFLLRRGNHETPGPEVEPGFLAVLCDSDADAVGQAPPDVPQGTSGRRLALARWLTDPKGRAGGLSARVMVNRIWQHLFGQGIVPTSENFGASGVPPTHPELLDWLAVEFMESGWRVKPLSRQILLTSAYRQASHTSVAAAAEPDPVQVDPDNQLLWKARLRRVESEVVRDAILVVSGKLNRAIGGPPLALENKPDGMVVIDPKQLARPEHAFRRSLYVLCRRNYHLSILNDFDQPVVTTNCSRRSPGAVVTQSLTLLNDPFIREQAGFFADRVLAAAGNEPIDRQVTSAFELALCRSPDDSELALAKELIARQEARYAAQYAAEAAAQVAAPSAAEVVAAPAVDCHRLAITDLCQMLFGSNEFLYLE